jgi:hypothetical protein
MTQTAFLVTQKLETFAKSESGKARFRGVALSGKLIPNRLYDGSALSIDINTFNLSEDGKKIFILADHDHRHRIGTAIAKKVGGQVVLEDGEFFTTPEGQNIATQFAEGAPFELSVGISGRTVFYEAKNRKARQLDGKKHDIGAEVFDAELMETSFVVAGADRHTSVHAFAKSIGAELLDDHKFTDLFSGDTTMELEQLKIELAASKSLFEKATADLAAKTEAETATLTKLSAAEAELSAIKTKQAEDKATARVAAIAEKFGAVSAEESEALLSMTDAQFAFAAKASKPAKQDFSGQNFNEQLEGNDGEKVSSLHAFAMKTGKIAKA